VEASFRTRRSISCWEAVPGEATGGCLRKVGSPVSLQRREVARRSPGSVLESLHSQEGSRVLQEPSTPPLCGKKGPPPACSGAEWWQGGGWGAFVERDSGRWYGGALTRASSGRRAIRDSIGDPWAQFVSGAHRSLSLAETWTTPWGPRAAEKASHAPELGREVKK
jgi:hypothetical protein